MKVFISYHRQDSQYKNYIISILEENNIQYYVVPENFNVDGLHHQHIASQIIGNMNDCDILICIVGRLTHTRPHVDWEIHQGLRGGVGVRRGIVAIMLETRGDSKNNINLETFPVRLAQNTNYIVIEQFATIRDRLLKALETARINRSKVRLQTNHGNPVMQLRSGRYFDQ
jgi:hypothetical protein